ncbi:MAG: hypothetical protein KA988_01035 [Longilinea sp.]|nr:hypothetical protein [Longilinea sp.]
MLMIVICIFSQYNPRLQQQRALAKKWNVEIENYPHPHYFPYGYFEEILEPGTGINEVHQIVVDYQRVMYLRSGTFDYELYYYYARQDQKALRIQVIYKDGRLEELRTEDSNSRSFSNDGYNEGLLETFP